MSFLLKFKCLRPIRRLKLTTLGRGYMGNSQDFRKPAAGEKIHITVDPELRAFLPKYLENRKADLDTLRAALEKDDFNALQMLIHKIKGHATSYGFTKLSPLCKQMETAAISHEKKIIATLLDEYADYISRVDISQN